MTKIISVDPFSYVSCLATTLCNGHVISRATCFFWHDDEDVTLITNWHVLSGRQPLTGQPLNADGAIPDTIAVTWRNLELPDVPHTYRSSLLLDGQPLWSQHARYGQDVDIASLSFKKLLGQEGLEKSKRRLPVGINRLDIVDLPVQVASEVFILGFPLGIMKTDVFPVWKRASVATEYEFPIDGKPMFLVDTATREGMSGSPVIMRAVTRFAAVKDMPSFQYDMATTFLGVYSGRHVGELQEAQLGIVWKAELIRELIAHASPGSYELRG